jgi:hypothetical protein
LRPRASTLVEKPGRSSERHGAVPRQSTALHGSRDRPPLDESAVAGNLLPMFLQFFTSLRDAQVPVTLREYLTLMEALDANLADQSVENFY